MVTGTPRQEKTDYVLIIDKTLIITGMPRQKKTDYVLMIDILLLSQEPLNKRRKTLLHDYAGL